MAGSTGRSDDPNANEPERAEAQEKLDAGPPK